MFLEADPRSPLNRSSSPLAIPVPRAPPSPSSSSSLSASASMSPSPLMSSSLSLPRSSNTSMSLLNHHYHHHAHQQQQHPQLQQQYSLPFHHGNQVQFANGSGGNSLQIPVSSHRPTLSTSMPLSLQHRASSSTMSIGSSNGNNHTAGISSIHPSTSPDSSSSLGSELICPQCGKSYRYTRQLEKHMWEHSPAWEIVSQFNYSKNEHCKILDAAEILCSLRS